MSWFDLQLVEGVPRPAAGAGAESELSAWSAEFAAGWSLIEGLHPEATLMPLFGGDDGLVPEVLEDLADAARMSGLDPPDLLRWFELECPDELAEVLLPVLEALPLFQSVGERLEPVPASGRDGVVSWGTNPQGVTDQALGRAPRGIDMIYGWRVDGGTGLGVKVADIESGWWLGHNDLITANIIKHSVFGNPNDEQKAHGTFCAGILVGADNGVGMVGIVPDAELLLVTHKRENDVSNPARAIAVAAAAVGRGGILLLEAAWPYKTKGKPDLLLEVDPPVHDAIRHATDRHVTVIEPAGNGTVDLAAPGQSYDPKSTAKFDFKLPTAKDSGAVVVGAGAFRSSTGKWERASFATHGDRVDCFADAGGIAAPLASSADGVADFGGSSAASAVIAGLAASLQGMQAAAGRTPFEPEELRAALSDAGLGTAPLAGQSGIGTMPDLRKIARSRTLARVLPVAAAPVGDDNLLLVTVDDEDRFIRRHFSFFSGWGRPLPPLDKGDLFAAQPSLIAWSEPDRLVYQLLASGRDGIQRAWWDSNLMQEPFTLLATASGGAIAPGSVIGAARAGPDELIIAGIDPQGALVAFPTGMLFAGLGGPIAIAPGASFRRSGGPIVLSRRAGLAEVIAIADHGPLVWCHGGRPFETGWKPPVVEPTFTPLVPGARPAALVVEDRLLIAAVGAEGWLRAIEIDPSQGAIPAAFEAPVVVDTGINFAGQGPLALTRLFYPPFDWLLLFGVDQDGLVQLYSRAAAGGDWTWVTALTADVPISALGGVTAMTSPDLGVFVFAVGVDGQVRVASARTSSDWSDLALLPEGVPGPPNPVPPDPPQPPSPPIPPVPPFPPVPPAPAVTLLSTAFSGDPVLEAIAADKDRISRTRHQSDHAVGKIQHALLLWDAASLPNYGQDGSYGDETALAVRRFKAEVLGVAPAQIIDDVGPATVLRLDRLEAEQEGLLGTRTNVRFLNEYGDPLPGLSFAVTTPDGFDMLTSDADGLASFLLSNAAEVMVDSGSALSVIGDLTNREWPPAAGMAEGVLLIPATATAAWVEPGDVLDLVVATRVDLSTSLASPLAGTVRVEGRGVLVEVTGDTVRLALQSTGGGQATVLIDPLPPSGVLPELPPLTNWTPIGTYTVQPGDTAEDLGQAFVGDPEGYSAISDHPPVPGEQLVLPQIPDWLGIALAPVSAPEPLEWFSVAPDAIVAVLDGSDPQALQDLHAVLDRPPVPAPDPIADLTARAETLAALLDPPPVAAGPSEDMA